MNWRILLLFFIICFAKIQIEKLKLLPGFQIEIFAKVENARQMTISPSGIIYVGSFQNGSVYALRPNVSSTHNIFIVDKNLLMPVGVAFHGSDLYVSSVDRILKYENIERNFGSKISPVIVTFLPNKTHHGWKYIKIHRDKLFVPIGAPCNICNVTIPYVCFNIEYIV
jgi:glucose/arabinose dehydrogenase